MFFKVCLVAALVGCAMATPYATSYTSVKQYHGHDDHLDHHNDYYPHYASSYSGYGNRYALGLGHEHDYDRQYDSLYNGYYGHHDDDHHDYYHHPQYIFKYGVEDLHTHDIKSQEEQHDGDVVKGHYKLVQPDGRTRVVHYTADKHNGFNANVQYLGHAEHPSYYKYY